MSHPPRISCIAIIGKHVLSLLRVFLNLQNNPLYIKTFPKPPSTPFHAPLNTSNPLPQLSPSLKYHFLAHSALDIIEERIISGVKTIDTYFGLLHVLEDVNIYGFLTNTLAKIIVMIEGADGSGGIRDSDVKAVMRRVHDAYVGVIFNPFYVPGEKEKITSNKFEKEIERISREWKPTV